MAEVSAVFAPSYEGKRIASCQLSTICADLIDLQDDNDDPREIARTQRELDKEWSVLVNKVLDQLLCKLHCRKCGAQPHKLNKVLVAPSKFKTLPEVLVELLKLSQHPEQLLGGILPTHPCWEGFLEVESRWWSVHLHSKAILDGEGLREFARNSFFPSRFYRELMYF